MSLFAGTSGEARTRGQKAAAAAAVSKDDSSSLKSNLPLSDEPLNDPTTEGQRNGVESAILKMNAGQSKEKEIQWPKGEVDK